MRWVDLGDWSDPAEAEQPVTHLSLRIDVEPESDGILLFSDSETAGLVKGAVEEGLPNLSKAEGFPPLLDPGIKGLSGCESFCHGGRMHPQAAPSLVGFDVKRWQCRGPFAAPAPQKKTGLIAELFPFLGIGSLETGSRCFRPLMQVRLGQEKLPITSGSCIQW